MDWESHGVARRGRACVDRFRLGLVRCCRGLLLECFGPAEAVLLLVRAWLDFSLKVGFFVDQSASGDRHRCRNDREPLLAKKEAYL